MRGKVFLMLNILYCLTKQLSFDLDANITEMCFYLEGSIVGKTLLLNYEVIGKNTENVKFVLFDKTDGERLLVLEDQKKAK